MLLFAHVCTQFMFSCNVVDSNGVAWNWLIHDLLVCAYTQSLLPTEQFHVSDTQTHETSIGLE